MIWRASLLTGQRIVLCAPLNHVRSQHNKHTHLPPTAPLRPTNRTAHTAGKRLQCVCGGDDASTEFLCGQQPGTNWDIFLHPHDPDKGQSWDAGTAVASVAERAGTYSGVRRTACTYCMYCLQSCCVLPVGL